MCVKETFFDYNIKTSVLIFAHLCALIIMNSFKLTEEEITNGGTTWAIAKANNYINKILVGRNYSFK